MFTTYKILILIIIFYIIICINYYYINGHTQKKKELFSRDRVPWSGSYSNIHDLRWVADADPIISTTIKNRIYSIHERAYWLHHNLGIYIDINEEYDEELLQKGFSRSKEEYKFFEEFNALYMEWHKDKVFLEQRKDTYPVIRNVMVPVERKWKWKNYVKSGWKLVEHEHKTTPDVTNCGKVAAPPDGCFCYQESVFDPALYEDGLREKISNIGEYKLVTISIDYLWKYVNGDEMGFRLIGARNSDGSKYRGRYYLKMMAYSLPTDNPDADIWKSHISHVIPETTSDFIFPFNIPQPDALFINANNLHKLYYDDIEDDGEKMWNMPSGKVGKIRLDLKGYANRIEKWWKDKRKTLNILITAIEADAKNEIKVADSDGDIRCINTVQREAEEAAKARAEEAAAKECESSYWNQMSCAVTGAITGALEALGGAVVAFVKAAGEIGSALSKGDFSGALKAAASAVACALGSLTPLETILKWLGIMGLLDGLIEKFLKPGLKLLDPILKPFKEFPITQTIKDTFNKFIKIMKEGSAKVNNFLTNNAKQIKNQILLIFTNITNDLTKIFDNIDLDSIYKKSKINTLMKRMSGGIGNMLFKVITKIIALSDKMTDVLKSILKIITTIFKTIWKVMSQGLTIVIGIFKTISKKLNLFIEKLEDVFIHIKLILNNFDDLIYNIRKTLEKLIKMLWRNIKKIVSYFKNVDYGIILPNIIKVIKNSMLSYVY